MNKQHPQWEDHVIHSGSDIVLSPEGTTVTRKLTNLISGALKSPVGEFPLTEFYYRLTDDLVEIYDRNLTFLVSAGILNFTEDEITWIIDNLPLFNDNDDHQDVSMIKLDFREWKRNGWIVFRVSGADTIVLGYIRPILSHVPIEVEDSERKPKFYFQERHDNVIVSKWERIIINRFIMGTIGDIDVTGIVVNPQAIDILVGDTILLNASVRPFDATYKGVLFQSNDTSVASVESNGAITGSHEGSCMITVSSEQLMPDGETSRASVNVPVRVTQLWEFINDFYLIEFDEQVQSKIIIGIDENTYVKDFINSFTNRREYIRMYTQFDYDITEDQDEYVGTGMYLTLVINDEIVDRLLVVVRGDLNGDGYVNPGDLSVMNNHIYETELLKDPFFKAGDLNNDGLVDELDRDILIDHLNNHTPLN